MAKNIQDFNRQVSRTGGGEAGHQAMLQELFLTKLGTPLRTLVEQARPENGWTNLSAMQTAAVKSHSTLHLQQGEAQPSGSNNSSQGSGQNNKRGQCNNRGNQSKRSRFTPVPQPTSGPNSRTNTSKWCTHCVSSTHSDNICRALKRLREQGSGRGRGGGRGGSTQPSKN